MIREFIIDTNNTAICHRGMVDGGGEKKYLETKKNIWATAVAAAVASRGGMKNEDDEKQSDLRISMFPA